ncbi:endolytic transglycosylase MltG [Candidatus Peregrinibacteria bacterium]|nr:endolytic transglycosylase MltG [Candidatus Peregrinibacteria bacterium]
MRLHGVSRNVQAGSFLLSPRMKTPEVVEILRTGKAQEIAVTIPEGFTLKDIDALLAKKGLMAPGAMLDCVRRCNFSSFEFLPSSKGLAPRGGALEGYLFPETYYAEPANFVPKFFLERLLGEFRRRVANVFKDDLQRSGRSLHEIVTMASLLEEEAKTDDERPVIAGVLWKRFDANTGLGVDAAVRYILEKPTGMLTADDLATQSSYNLRKFRGLPPGPIASPGIASIRAALDPQPSEYWYYLHGKDGKVHYAVTNEEHNVNKAKYLR